jgi:hypothetical protein
MGALPTPLLENGSPNNTSNDREAHRNPLMPAYTWQAPQEMATKLLRECLIREVVVRRELHYCLLR